MFKDVGFILLVISGDIAQGDEHEQNFRINWSISILLI